MKQIILVAAGVLLSCPISAPAQGGSLFPPPGAPAPTMKPLDLIEPRTAISALPYTISQSGSYYVTKDLNGVASQHGVTITADNVTLDLNGFALIGTSTDFVSGVYVDGARKNLAVKNGTVRNWYNGLDAENAISAHISEVRASNNLQVGIFAGLHSLVTACVARDNWVGIGSSGCVRHCIASANTDTGISMEEGSVLECVANGNGDKGIDAYGKTEMRNNECRGNEVGIEVYGKCQIGNNHISGNTSFGLVVRFAGTGSVISNNRIQDNNDNYQISGDNELHILLCQIPESIDWPATVTLAGTLKAASGQSGITINSDDVTIDLAGHALVGPGTGAATNGVLVSGTRSNVEVRNGSVRAWMGHGIDAGSAKNSRFKELRTTGNAVDGLRSGASALVSDCISNGNTGNGIVINEGTEVRECVANLNLADGIQGGLGCTIRRCTVRGNKTDGIEVVSGCVVAENNADANGENGDGAGINLTSGGNRIDSNNIVSCDRGIDSNPATGNVIVRNTAKSNGVNFDIAAGNSPGEIISTAGATIITDKPWANFAY